MLKNIEKNIALRPYNEDDFEVLKRIRNDIDLQLLLLSHPKPNNYKKVIEWIEQKSNNTDSVFFVIAGNNNLPLGFIQATQMDLISGTCYIGIVIDDKFRGKGIAAAAIGLLENYLTEVFNIRKTIVHILSENQSSQKTFSKSGYEIVGVFKQHFYFKNKLHDVAIMEKIHPR